MTKENRTYWNLKEEVLDRALCRNRTGKSCGTVARKTSQYTTCRPTAPLIFRLALDGSEWSVSLVS